MTTARTTLTADFQAKKKAGLRDLKFFLGNVSETTVEEVCADVNRVFAAVKDGNYIVHKSWGDSHRPKAVSAK